MVTTPRSIIDSVVRSVCGRELERLTPLAGGGMNEAYRADLAGDVAVVVRIARQDSPWFVDEACLMGLAREAGVPTAEVLGLEHRDHDGELLSFSIQEFLPGRLLSEVVGELTTSDLEALVMDLGEILARVHSVIPNDQRGILREQPHTRCSRRRQGRRHRQSCHRPGGSHGGRARSRPRTPRGDDPSGVLRSRSSRAISARRTS